MNTVLLQIKRTKGLIPSYQSYLVLKPLHSAESVTYFHFEYTARYPQGTHNFRTTLFNSRTAGKAKPSSINALLDYWQFWETVV